MYKICMLEHADIESDDVFKKTDKNSSTLYEVDDSSQMIESPIRSFEIEK